MCLIQIVQFTLGYIGQQVCPEAYEPIKFPNTCKLASTILGLPYVEDNNNGKAESICFSAGDHGGNTYIGNDYASLSKWVCQKSGYATGG